MPFPSLLFFFCIQRYENLFSHIFSDPNDCIMELLMVCYALKTSCCRKVIGKNISLFPFNFL